jgi:hypothetical protein
MKLVTFETGGTQRIGVVADEGIVDLSHTSLPPDMIGLIAAWAQHEAEVRR